MSHTHTHTYAILTVSQAAYDEIRAKLLKAGYQDQFHEKSNGEVIDMHGIALKEEEVTQPAVHFLEFGAREGRCGISATAGIIFTGHWKYVTCTQCLEPK